MQIERAGHILQSLGATAFSEDGVRLCPLIVLRVFLNSRGECPKYVMSRSCRGSASIMEPPPTPGFRVLYSGNTAIWKSNQRVCPRV